MKFFDGAAKSWIVFQLIQTQAQWACEKKKEKRCPTHWRSRKENKLEDIFFFEDP